MTALEQPGPFAERRYRLTPDKAKEAQARSVASRRKNREDAALRRQQIERMAQELDHSQVGPVTLAAAFKLAIICATGEVPVPKDALERKRLAETAEILHRIARLELGESTSNIAHATASNEERTEQLAQLQARMDALREVVDVQGVDHKSAI